MDLKLAGKTVLITIGHMKSRGRGVIVNVIGMAAERPSWEYVCGATANAGLGAFTKALGGARMLPALFALGVQGRVSGP